MEKRKKKFKKNEYKALSDEALQHKTVEFKEMLAEGKTLDDILPEAFATVREASKRVLGMRHFDVQLIGGIILHQGRIAEMKTGEGKTLVATLPVYLNALTGKGVHVITVNDYLAKRDSEWMGKIFEFLGLSVGVILLTCAFSVLAVSTIIDTQSKAHKAARDAEIARHNREKSPHNDAIRDLSERERIAKANQDAIKH